MALLNQEGEWVVFGEHLKMRVLVRGIACHVEIDRWKVAEGFYQILYEGPIKICSILRRKVRKETALHPAGNRFFRKKYQGMLWQCRVPEKILLVKPLTGP
jgi:hypothetical protein